MKANSPERFWQKVDKSGDCWLWLGRKRNGYGLWDIGSKAVTAHRYCYELVVGPVRDGLVLDHLCRNRACCNPAHLEVVTHKVNILRGESPGAMAVKTDQCIHGHPFDEANTIVYAGTRRCRKCMARRTAEYEKRTKRWLRRKKQ